MAQQAHATSEKAGHPIPPIIILTAYSSVNRVVEAMKLGACDFLTKPFDPDHLGMVIQKVLERESLKREVTHLRSDLEVRYSTIVAESAKMQEVVTAAKRAARPIASRCMWRIPTIRRSAPWRNRVSPASGHRII